MIAWVDVETTCLDPNEGDLLEVGIVLTDDWLVELDKTSAVIQPRQETTWGAGVMRMHADSGLRRESLSWSALPLRNVEDCLVGWLEKRVGDGPPPLAGSTVGFDRAWLKATMPRLEALFHYRSIDVSSLKELNARWGFAPKWDAGRKLHRALPDIEDSIDELRHYCGALLTTGDALLTNLRLAPA